MFKAGRGGFSKLEDSVILLLVKSRLYNLIKIVYTCLNRRKKNMGIISNS